MKTGNPEQIAFRPPDSLFCDMTIFGAHIKESLGSLFLIGVLYALALLSGGKDVLGQAIFFILLFPLLFFSLRALPTTSYSHLIARNAGTLTPFLIFIGIAAVSLLWTVARYPSLFVLLLWVGYFFIFFASFLAGSVREKARSMINFEIILAVTLAIIGIYFFIISENYSSLRLVSTFYWHNAFGGFLILILPIPLLAYVHSTRGRTRFVYCFAATMLAAALVLTSSRGSWFSHFFLKISSELGIIGFVAFLFLLIRILRETVFWPWYTNKKETGSAEINDILSVGIAVGMLAEFIHIGMDADWEFSANAVLFFTNAAFCMTLRAQPNQDKFRDVPPTEKKSKNEKYVACSRYGIPIALFVCAGISIIGVFVYIGEQKYRDALYYLNSGETREAYAFLRQGVVFNPVHPGYRKELGKMVLRMIADDQTTTLDLDFAEKEIVSGISFNGRDSEAHFLLANIFFKKGNVAAAEAEFRKSFLLSPKENIDAVTALAFLYKNQGRLDEAALLLESFLAQYSPALFESVLWSAPNKELIKKRISILHAALGETYFSKNLQELAEEQFIKA